MRENIIKYVIKHKKISILLTLLSILIMLLKPKNKGRFCQINTGEGKSSIVSILATIKALQNKYVDVLSSSIVLAKRDVEEKKNFYSLFLVNNY